MAVGIVHVKEALTPLGVTWRGGWPISRRDDVLVNRIDFGNVENERKDIRSLERAGIPTGSAEGLLGRMLANVDHLCAERDRRAGNNEKNIPAQAKSSMGRSRGASGEASLVRS